MAPKVADEQQMIRYLLGELPEAEQLRLEEQFFTDEEFYQQLLAVEDELRYDYAQGLLSPKQRREFEKRFLTSLKERQGVELAQAVLGKLATLPAPERSPVTDAQPKLSSWWQSLLAFFTAPHPLMQASLAALAVALFLGGVWLAVGTRRLHTQIAQLQSERARARQSSHQQASEQQAQQDRLKGELADERQTRAQLEEKLSRLEEQASKQAAQTQPPHPTLLSFVLTPGLLRGEESQKKLVVPAGVDQLRLQLEVKKKGDYQRYRALLQTLDGGELWSQDLPRAGSSGGQAIVLKLPARLLAAGDYVIVLKGVTPGGEVEEAGDYYFTVDRR